MKTTLTVATLIVCCLACTNPALADRSFIFRLSQLFPELNSTLMGDPNGETVVAIRYPTDPADFVRINGDGTFWFHANASNVEIRLLRPTGDPQTPFEQLLVGTGNWRISTSVNNFGVFIGDQLTTSLRADVVDVNGTEYTLMHQLIVRNGEIKRFHVQVEPR